MKTRWSVFRASVFLWLNRVRSLFRRGQLDRDMAEEMRVHIEEQAEHFIEGGMEPDDARTAARRQFGGVTQIEERSRDANRWVWLEQILRDIRYALRQLRKAPGFTSVTVLTLAFGIGATTSVFSVIDTLILNPIPGPDSDRLIQIGEWVNYSNRAEPNHAGVSPPVFEALENEQTLFAGFAWHDSAQLMRKTDTFDERIFGQFVSSNFFTLLGVRPLIGRTFIPEDAVAFGPRRVPETDAVIIVSHAWWRSQFGADPNVLGSTITLSDCQLTIVGIMPSYFQFPSSAQFWIPALPTRPQPRMIGAPNTGLLVRLKSEADEQQVQALLEVVTQRLMNEYAADDRGPGQWWRRGGGELRLWSAPLRNEIQGNRYNGRFDAIQRTLFGLLAATGFVLAIVCANVANLSLARTERRQQELAVRAALGAGRWRLLCQLLTENLVLATLGGVASLAVTAWGMRLLSSLTAMPRMRPVEVNDYVLLTALGVSLVTGLVFGLAPAFRAGRVSVYETFRQCGTGAKARTGRNTYRNTLVVAEIALSLILLTGAGLMIQSVVRLLQVDPGFNPENLISVSLRITPNRPTPEAVEAKNQLAAQISERLAALPGVVAAGLFKDQYNSENIIPTAGTEPVPVFRAHCGIEESDFFRAAGIPLLSGRPLRSNDIGSGTRTVVVNEMMASLCWPGKDPVGQTFRVATREDEPEYTVIGVVGNARLNRFDEEMRPLFYRPFSEARAGGTSETVVLRTEREPSSLVPTIRRALQSEAPNMEAPGIRVKEQVLYDATQTQRTYRNYMVVFAAVGLLLAALGIYGVLAYSVAQRTKEIGIRIAVGAERRHIRSLVIRDGARLIVIGVTLGLLASFWLTRYLQAQLFEVSPMDVGVVASVIVVLSTVALLACYLPARRATRVDPVIALRAE